MARDHGSAVSRAVAAVVSRLRSASRAPIVEPLEQRQMLAAIPMAPELSASASSTNVINLSWAAPANSAIDLQLEVKAPKDTNYHVVEMPTEDPITPDLYHFDTGLTAATTYSFRLRANHDGYADYSDAVSVTTKAFSPGSTTTPPPVPTVTGISNLTAVSGTVEFEGPYGFDYPMNDPEAVRENDPYGVLAPNPFYSTWDVIAEDTYELYMVFLSSGVKLKTRLVVDPYDPSHTGPGYSNEFTINVPGTAVQAAQLTSAPAPDDEVTFSWTVPNTETDDYIYLYAVDEGELVSVGSWYYGADVSEGSITVPRPPEGSEVFAVVENVSGREDAPEFGDDRFGLSPYSNFVDGYGNAQPVAPPDNLSVDIDSSAGVARLLWDNVPNDENDFGVQWSHNNSDWTDGTGNADEPYSQIDSPGELGWIAGKDYFFRVWSIKGSATSSYETASVALDRPAPFVCESCSQGNVTYQGNAGAAGQSITDTGGSFTAGQDVSGNGKARSGDLTLAQLDGNDSLTVIYSSGDQIFFDLDAGTGRYVGDFGITDTLVHKGSEFILTDARGNRYTFSDTFTNDPSGAISRVTAQLDSGGNRLRVYSTNGSGQRTEVRVTDTDSVDRESWLYTYFTSGPAAGLLQTITQRVKNGSGWTTTRILDYTYHDGTTDQGLVGQIRTIKFADGSGNALDQQYFRYYVEGEEDGPAGALKFTFSSDAYEKVLDAYSETDPDELTDTELEPYADTHTVYDDAGRVSSRTVQGAGCSTCSGGQGSYGYTYEVSEHADGINSWHYKKTETLPDGNQNVSYYNAFGQVMLTVFVDDASGDKWGTFHKYDADGREVLIAAPSAVALPSSLATIETYADLLHNVSGNYEYLNDSTGFISTIAYAITTTATESSAGNVAGYMQSRSVQRGETGTAIVQGSTTYIAHDDDTDDADDTLGGGAGDDITIYAVASDTVYSGTGGTGGQTTSYTYTWFTDSLQAESKTTTNPTVSTGNNGSGSATSSVNVYDTFGRVVWYKDEAGFIRYNEYHGVSGGLTRQIVDVNTSTVSNEPSGWTTPGSGGLHIATDYVVDELGRTTKTTDANGNVTYTIYDDEAHEVRTYRGWNATTGLPTGPIEVSREDRARGYSETLTMSATPSTSGSSGSYVPTGTESIASIQSLTRSIYNASGQLIESASYIDLTGTSYSASIVKFGTEGTNYYLTQYGYDNRGRQARVKNPNGTWTHTVYDGLDRVTSTWVGTNNTGWTHTNPGNGGTGGNNMLKVSESEYDGGDVGDGNLTKSTSYPGAGATARVSAYFYDWRNRLVASKSGVQGSEGTDVQRQIAYADLNNLGQQTATYVYDGDNVTLTDGNSDGVPDKPSSSLLRAKTVNEFDEQSRQFRTTTYAVNPSNGDVSSTGIVNNTWFDARGQVIKSAGTASPTQKTVYDGAGRVTKSYVSDGGSDSVYADADDVTGDIVLEQSEYAYDGNGNVIKTTARQRFHDATDTGELGNPASSSGTAKARVSYTASYYDPADRLTDSINVGTNGGSSWTRPADSLIPSRADDVLRTSYSYSAAGRLQDVTDPRGIVARTEYDLLGRTTRTIEAYSNGVPTDSTNRITAYTYDGLDNITHLKAVLPDGPDGGSDYDVQETQYVYGAATSRGDGLNSNDILIAVRYPDKTTGLASSGAEEVLKTSALGQTIEKTDRNGTEHTFSYDVVGRLLSDSITDLGSGVDDAVLRIETSYNTQGLPENITSFDDDAGGDEVNQVRRVYNGLGQLITEYQDHDDAVNTGTTPKVQYGYSSIDDGSRLTLLTYPNGRELEYVYDSGLDSAISRLSSIKDGAETLEEYAYLGLSGVVQRLHPENGIDLTYVGTPADAGDQYAGLDRFGRIVDQKWTDGAALDEYQYGYDRNSNRTSKANPLYSSADESYSYDDLSRLVSADRNSSAYQSWTLDALGNSETISTSAGTEARVHNRQNQLEEMGELTLEYDASGNTTTDQHNRKLTYDAWNRMVAAGYTSDDMTVVRYDYDGLGRRVSEGSLGPTPLTTGTINPASYTESDGELFFAAHDSSHGWELWKTDGTAGGTALVKDIVPGSGSSGPATLTDIADTLYFTTDSGLWISDGTSIGTTHLIAATVIGPIVEAGGDVFFVCQGSTSYELWKTDGTALGTTLVVDLGATAPGTEMLGVNGDLFFTLDDGTHGSELWKSDGTSLGTVLVADVASGSDAANPSQFLEYEGDLFFTADDGFGDVSLWRTDGTSMGTELVVNISTEVENEFWEFVVVNDLLFFSASDGYIWKTDGTTLGTSQVAFGGNPFAYNDEVYFIDHNDYSQKMTDGTVLGTVEVLPVGEPNGIWFPGRYVISDGSLYMIGKSFGDGPSDWFVTDGTDAGTHSIGIGDVIDDVPVSVNGALVFTSGGQMSTLAMKKTDVYFSDQWQELEDRSDSNTIRSFVWSPVYVDALIARDRNTSGDDSALEERLYALQDANFNVTAVADTTGNIVERYLYDPYGKRTILDYDFNPSYGNTSGFDFQHGHQGGKYNGVLSNQILFRNRVYDVETMRWLQQDPLGHPDGLNRYDRGSPASTLDPLGLKIHSSCDISGYLRENVKMFTKERAIYSGPTGEPEEQLESEIIAGMLNEEWVFRVIGRSKADAIQALKAHVAARVQIVANAAAKRYKFGAGEDVKRQVGRGVPNLDPQKYFNRVNNPETVIACLEASMITFYGGSGIWGKHYRRPVKVWIPGDWGYILNEGNDTDDSAFVAGLEGENIIYVGKNKWWGHLSDQNEYKTLDEWIARVNAFESTNPQVQAKATLRSTVDYPTNGVEAPAKL